jgi:hypothetical protein
MIHAAWEGSVNNCFQRHVIARDRGRSGNHLIRQGLLVLLHAPFSPEVDLADVGSIRQAKSETSDFAGHDKTVIHLIPTGPYRGPTLSQPVLRKAYAVRDAGLQAGRAVVAQLGDAQQDSDTGGSRGHVCGDWNGQVREHGKQSA